MRISYDRYKFLFVVNKKLTKDIFLELAGAGKGYSKQLFSEIYDSIFSEAENIEDVYTKYYTPEYSSLREFIIHKYCIIPDNVDKLLRFKAQDEDYTIISYDAFAYGYNNVEDFIHPQTEDLIEIRNKFDYLFLMKLKDENKD